MKIEIFSLIGLFLGIVGIVLSFLTLSRKVRAEKKFEEILRQRKEEILNQQLKELEDDKKKIDLTEEEFIELQYRIKSLVSYLKKDERKEILESLDQKSLKGQVDYVNKMLHNSGSTENVSVKIH